MLSGYETYCFGGHRAPSAFDTTAAQHALSFLLLDGVTPSQVVTSCGVGVPSLAVAHFPECRFFSASSDEYKSLGRGAFAARAAAMIRHLSAQPSPVFVCFPQVAPPSSLRVRRSWQSCGSGSWSEVAMSIGFGVPTLVFLPAGVAPPPSLGQWTQSAAAPGGLYWFLSPPPSLL